MRVRLFRARQSGVSIKRVLSTVFTIALLVAYVAFHSNRVLGRVMLVAFDGDDTTYQASWPGFTGTISAKNVHFPLMDGSSDDFVFEKVRIEIPFWQYFRSLLSRKERKMFNAISDVKIVLTGGQGTKDSPFGYELAAFGGSSGALFEAFGCAEDSLWSTDELKDMGLTPGPTEVIVEYHRDGDTLNIIKSIDTPGVARVAYRGSMTLRDTSALLSLRGSGDADIVQDEWEIEDRGFVAARNQHCAKKDKVTPDQVVARHVASVSRALAAVGVAGHENLVNAYREFATKGGKIALNLKYDPPITVQQQESDTLSSWLPAMRGQFTFNGTPMALSLESTAPRPLPGMDEEAEDYDDTAPLPTMVQVLRSEGIDPVQLGYGVAPAAAAPAATAPGSAVVVASATAPAVTTAPPVSTAVTPAAPSVAAPATPVNSIAAAAPARAVETVRAPAAPAVVPLDDEPPPPPPAGTPVAYADLGKWVGKRVAIYMKARPAMYGEVAGVEKGIVQLRRRIAGGWALMPIDKSNFERAELAE
ncbi:hypothetical protein [Tahibacter amnicola]|uniref:Uncharacterized protein n=1 Tax=Tahibacter amnicola TaxID=2976241 RepID=A0ABY6BGG1_9GAMM|nr:hypothetical protein [Tahibacter amnicola]UXI68165.1 hypothetical protein N4264_00485 [Tahibacter amnicola]